MKASEPRDGSTTKPATSTPLRGMQLKALCQDAAQQLEPVLAKTSSMSSSQRLFLAMNRLQAIYPHLLPEELEALLLGVMKQQQKDTH